MHFKPKLQVDMELALAAGLALAGYGFTNKPSNISKKPPKRVNQLRKNNQYDSNQLVSSDRALYDRAVNLNKLSKLTAQTGVVANNANRLPDRKAWENSRESDLDGASFDTFDSISSANDEGVMNGGATNWMVTEAKLRKPLSNNNNKANNNSTSGYLEQFEPIRFDNPGRAVGSNDVSGNINTGSMVKSEAGMALDGGWSNYSGKKDMTYGVVAPGELDHFRRTQLVPYFAAKTYGGGGDARRRDGNIQGRLELFTGADELKPSKQEGTPLFKPVKNSGNVFGTPVTTEYEMDRYYVSGRREGEKPFEPIRDTPGLDVDYNQVGSGALKPSYDYRPLPKTIDQLRQANKPQISYTAPVVQGQKGSVRGLQAPVNKNKVYRVATNKQSDLQRSSFITTAPKTRENYSLGKTLREDTHVMYSGAPNAIIADRGDGAGFNIRGKVQDSSRTKLAGYDPGPAGQTGAGGIRREQHQLYDNQRMNTEKTNFIGGGNQTSMGTAYNPNDTLVPTIRSVTGTDSAGYSAVTGSSYHGQVPHSDTAKPTIRSMTGADSAGYSAVTGSAKHGQVNYSDIAKPTIRQTLPESLPMGSLTGDYLATKVVDYSDMPGHTGRELIETGSYNGPLQDGVGQMPASWDQLAINFKETTIQPMVGAGFTGSSEGGWTRNDLVLDPTMRQLTSKNLIGNTTQTRDGGYGVNPQQAFNTQRQTMEQNNQIRGATHASHQGGYAANPQQVPTTLKQLLESTRIIAGGASRVGEQGGYGANPQQAFTTQRQDTEVTGQIRGAANAGQQGGYGANPQQAFITQRQDTEVTSQIRGAANAGRQGGYDANPQQAINTLRQGYEGTVQVGGAANGGQQGGYGANPQQAFNTLRQGYEGTMQIGVADNAGKQGGYGANPQQAFVTQRQDTEGTNYIGGADNAGAMGGYGANPQHIPNTLRQLYEATMALGVATAGVTNGGYGTNPTEMRTTARQNTLAERRGGGNAAVEMHTPYAGYYRAETTDNTMVGRPIAGNIQVGYSDSTAYRYKNTQNSARLEGGGSANPLYSNGMGDWTRNGVTTPQENVRLDPILISQLNDNPYNIPHFTSPANFGRQDGYYSGENNEMETTSFTQL